MYEWWSKVKVTVLFGVKLLIELIKPRYESKQYKVKIKSKGNEKVGLKKSIYLQVSNMYIPHKQSKICIL